jgi:hypothetical protein
MDLIDIPLGSALSGGALDLANGADYTATAMRSLPGQG